MNNIYYPSQYLAKIAEDKEEPKALDTASALATAGGGVVGGVGGAKLGEKLLPTPSRLGGITEQDINRVYGGRNAGRLARKRLLKSPSFSDILNTRRSARYKLLDAQGDAALAEFRKDYAKRDFQKALSNAGELNKRLDHLEKRMNPDLWDKLQTRAIDVAEKRAWLKANDADKFFTDAFYDTLNRRYRKGGKLLERPWLDNAKKFEKSTLGDAARRAIKSGRPDLVEGLRNSVGDGVVTVSPLPDGRLKRSSLKPGSFLDIDAEWARQDKLADKLMARYGKLNEAKAEALRDLDKARGRLDSGLKVYDRELADLRNAEKSMRDVKELTRGRANELLKKHRGDVNAETLERLHSRRAHIQGNRIKTGKKVLGGTAGALALAGTMYGLTNPKSRAAISKALDK